MKTITFAICHFSVAFGVTYLFTGSILLGGIIAMVEPAVNTIVYHLHEKFWEQKNKRSLDLNMKPA